LVHPNITELGNKSTPEYLQMSQLPVRFGETMVQAFLAAAVGKKAHYGIN